MAFVVLAMAGRVQVALACGPDVASAARHIRAVNAETGTTSWFVPVPDQASIDGYAGEVSYTAGDDVRLFVDSGGAPFSFAVYRLGYYAGNGGQLVYQQSVSFNPAQPRPTISDDHAAGAKLLRTGWHVSSQFTVPAGWASGFYLVKLTNDATGGSSYANFVVRASVPAPVVVVFPTNTWEAYNLWHRLSLYRDLRLPMPQARNQALVAHMVSFHRPYDREYGAADFFRLSWPLVSYLEMRGYPVSYATDQDVRLGDVAGAATRLVIVAGHSEYQSGPEIDRYRRWRNDGIDLALLGGNDVVWHARFNRTEHTMTVWRLRRLDPRKDGREPTVRWESLGMPQNGLTGEQQAWGRPSSRQRAFATSSWPWRGAGVSPGLPFGDPQGHEYDGMTVNRVTPRRELILARTRLEHPSPTGSAQEMTLTSHRGRGWVFSSGQAGFAWFLDHPSITPAGWIGRSYPSTSHVSGAVRRLVGNLIERATGYPNPEPATTSPPRVTPPMKLLAPRGREAVYRYPGRDAVLWADASPNTARVTISFDGHRYAVASPARDTWVGRAPRLAGWHIITVTAFAANGRRLASSSARVDMLDPGNPVFDLNINRLDRDWN